MSGASNKRAEGASGRVLALAVAALWVAGQASGVLHLVFVPHVFCAEHGEFLDASPGDDSGPGAEARSTVSPEGALVEAGSTEARAAHGHEHCLVTARCRRQLASTFRQPEPVQTVCLIAQRESVVDNPYGSLVDELFRLAPKNSPPV
jgi:hypothetical protein